jgi:hypothetical protein
MIENLLPILTTKVSDEERDLREEYLWMSTAESVAQSHSPYEAARKLAKLIEARQSSGKLFFLFVICFRQRSLTSSKASIISNINITIFLCCTLLSRKPQNIESSSQHHSRMVDYLYYDDFANILMFVVYLTRNPELFEHILRVLTTFLKASARVT